MMSELKRRHINEVMDMFCFTKGDLNWSQVYYADDADKVIAELKSQKAQVEDDCAYWKMREGNAENAMHETEEYAMQLYNELRHSKYKRCLAMARECSVIVHVFPSCLNHSIAKDIWYRKWRERWLALADKFKDMEA